MNEPELAQKNYREAIRIQKELKDEKGLATIYFNLAYLFIDVQQWPQAYQYLKEADNISRKTDLGWMTIINRATLAATCTKINKIAEAQALLKEIQQLLPKAIYDLERVYFYHAQGALAYFFKNYAQSLQYHQKAFSYAKDWKDPYFIADELMAIGEAYHQLNNADSTLKYYKEALKVAEKKTTCPK
ncbi:MAG: hypothetical protein R2822_30660 [Spirosomataceae bacterium]